MTRYAVLSLLAGLLYGDTLLVLNKSENTLAIVDPGAGKVLGRVPTGDGPHELALSGDGKLAFAANYGSREPGSSISVIDIAARKELKRVDLSPLRRPHGMAFAEGKVYFTAEANRLIARLDPATGRVDWLMGTGQNGTHMVLPGRGLRHLFTANIGSDSVTAFERVAGPQEWNATLIPVGKGPEGLDLSPDGAQLWTAHSRDGGVSIIDVAAKKVIGTLDLGTKRSNRLKFTPDGKRVLVSDMEGGELVVVDAAARKQLKRIRMGRNPEGIVVQPDGAKAYVAVAGEDHVAVVDLNKLEITSTILTGSGPDGMAWAR